jgi:hypothetical protein
LQLSAAGFRPPEIFLFAGGERCPTHQKLDVAEPKGTASFRGATLLKFNCGAGNLRNLKNVRRAGTTPPKDIRPCRLADPRPPSPTVW